MARHNVRDNINSLILDVDSGAPVYSTHHGDPYSCSSLHDLNLDIDDSPEMWSVTYDIQGRKLYDEAAYFIEANFLYSLFKKSDDWVTADRSMMTFLLSEKQFDIILQLVKDGHFPTEMTDDIANASYVNHAIELATAVFASLDAMECACCLEHLAPEKLTGDELVRILTPSANFNHFMVGFFDNCTYYNFPEKEDEVIDMLLGMSDLTPAHDFGHLITWAYTEQNQKVLDRIFAHPYPGDYSRLLKLATAIDDMPWVELALSRGAKTSD